MTYLDERSPALVDALKAEGLEADCLHTGGGCMVARAIFDEGCELWLTREEDWLLGFYNFVADEEDEGVCTTLLLFGTDKDDAQAVARAVAGIAKRMGR